MSFFSERFFAFFLIAALYLFAQGHATAAEEQSLPTREEAVSVCTFVAQIPVDDLRHYGIKFGYFDANNDGTPEIAKRNPVSGTMGGDPVGLFGADEKPLPIETRGFEWKTYWTFGNWWIPYDGKFYRLATKEEDGRYLSHLSYVGPTNTEHVLCEFKNKSSRSLHTINEEDRDVCKDAETGQLDYLADAAGPTESRKAEVLDRWSTYPRDEFLVDFDNQGTKDSLWALSFQSGAGRGCTLEYFDLLTASGNEIDTGSARDVLMALQKVDTQKTHNPGPTCAGDLARWFARNGKVYLEVRSKNAGAPQGSVQEYHSIAIAEGTETRDVCRARFELSRAVAGYNEALWAK